MAKKEKAATLRKNIKKVRDRVVMPDLPLETVIEPDHSGSIPDVVIGDDESITLQINSGDALANFNKHENEVMLAARRRINEIVDGRDADVLEGPSSPMNWRSDEAKEMSRIRNRIDAIVGDEDIFDERVEPVTEDTRPYPTRFLVRLHKLILDEVSGNMDRQDDWIGLMTTTLDRASAHIQLLRNTYKTVDYTNVPVDDGPIQD